jgi:hypothetical protein
MCLMALSLFSRRRNAAGDPAACAARITTFAWELNDDSTSQRSMASSL